MVLEIPNRYDDATLIEQWRSALPRPTKRVTRTMCYDIRTSATLLREVDRLRHDQRAVYNRVIESLPPEGGNVPTLQKSIKHPDGFYEQLTQWRGENAHKLKDEDDNEWFGSIPIAIARPAVAQKHEALKAHGSAVKGRTIRTLEEHSNEADRTSATPLIQVIARCE